MDLPVTTASAFARSTLANVVREYPNKLDHVLTGPGDLQSPSQLHPIFFGCFDWHSCVHGYWQLVKLRRIVSALPQRAAIEERCDSAFTVENVAAEIRYFHRPQSQGFERPYGWAWLLMLCHELSLNADDRGQNWHRTLLPLGDLIADRFMEFLPKASYPIRSGAHANMAFAFILSLEFARSHGHRALLEMICQKAREWYGGDRDCLGLEPSQTDFLSPALVESLCMSRVLPADEFRGWIAGFLPRLADRSPRSLFQPAGVSDRTDCQIAHLDGLNLSRAWCFRSIADSYSENSEQTKVLRCAAQEHLAASLPHLFDHYAGEHWLASFALLALNK
jgi:hypothetical protein